MKNKKQKTRRKLTEILVSMGAVDQVTMDRAASEYYDRPYGEWLVEHGLITQDTLDLALAMQAVESGDYGGATTRIQETSTKVHARTVQSIDAIGVALARLAHLGRMT